MVLAAGLGDAEALTAAKALVTKKYLVYLESVSPFPPLRIRNNFLNLWSILVGHRPPHATKQVVPISRQSRRYDSPGRVS